MAQRVFIAGVAPNTPDVMVRWLRDPPSVDTLTAMPMLGLSDAEARDAAAFVYTLR
jgi:cytochrome c1